MRIVIDMQGAQTESRFRGIGRYSLSLAQAIVRIAGEHDIWLVANALLHESIPILRKAFEGLISQERIRIFDVPMSARHGKWGSLASELIREEFIASLAPDVVLLTSVFEGHWAKAVTSIGVRPDGPKTAAILYDLIPLVNQKTYLPTKELQDYYFAKLEWLKKADLVLAISASSRTEGIELLDIPAAQIVNISSAVGPQFRPDPPEQVVADALLKRLGITRKLVMYAPGGFDLRKNFARLIEAYSGLSVDLRAQHQLVIVGRLHPAQRQELTDVCNRCGLSVDELVLTDYIEDQELINLYSLAELFVFPSLHEGFGLPLLEAMACGAVVVGSNCTSIPEVIGEEDALFDPLSVNSIRDKLMQALTDRKFREHLRKHGLAQAQRFSWDACASRAMAALEALHIRPQTPSASAAKNVPLLSSLTALAHEVEPDDCSLRLTAQCVAYNQGNDHRQLLLDISSLVHSDAKSGIQRVVRSLLSELMGNPPVGFDVLPIYFDGHIYRHAALFSASLVSVNNTERTDLPINICQDDIYLSLDLIMHLTHQVRDIHKDFAARGVKLYFIVYDLLLAQHPEWWAPGFGDQFNAWLVSISEIATGLICISRAVRDEVSGWLQANPSRRIVGGPEIAWFHLGADVGNSLPSRGMPDSAELTLRQIAIRKSFLMVSTIEPRKGYAQALAAFNLLWDQGEDVNLIIVGKRGWLVDDLVSELLAHKEKDKRLFWLEGISDEYLEKIYATSTCLIAASQGEGFGLPLIEAARHKLPIIARDIPVFREVAGEHAYYFETIQPAELARAVRAWLALFKAGIHPRSDVMPSLTWKESVAQLMQILLGRPG
ncbi:D-inositol 3-phosphate glycosyltransferase [compost metagenome]